MWVSFSGMVPKDVYVSNTFGRNSMDMIQKKEIISSTIEVD